MNGSTFTMEKGRILDNETEGTGSCGGVYVSGFGARFTMKDADGIISGNTAANNGGGVGITSGGAFTLENGKILDNSATNLGGGVYVNDSTFTLQNGIISENNATEGGGVYVTYASFTMEGGEISKNTATANGGGVWLNYDAAITKTSGVIYGNSDPKSNIATAGKAVFVSNTSNTAALVTLEKTVDAAHNLTKATSNTTSGSLTPAKGWEDL
jgi:hypothetical protein